MTSKTSKKAPPPRGASSNPLITAAPKMAEITAFVAQHAPGPTKSAVADANVAKKTPPTPAVVAATPPLPARDVALDALRVEIGELKALIVRALAAAKAVPVVNTAAAKLSDILAAPPASIPKGDARLVWHGVGIDADTGVYDDFRIFPFKFDKKEDLVLSGALPIPCLIAIPRDSDIGGQGAIARASGRVAVYTARSEDGSAFMAPIYYVDLNEIEALRADCQSPQEAARKLGDIAAIRKALTL